MLAVPLFSGLLSCLGTNFYGQTCHLLMDRQSANGLFCLTNQSADKSALFASSFRTSVNFKTGTASGVDPILK